MEGFDHPLPTPPSIPSDTYERAASPRVSEDPLSASPDLSHHAVVEAFTSDVRDRPPTPTQQPHTVNIPRVDSSIEFDRPSSEPAMMMDVDVPNETLVMSEM